MPFLSFFVSYLHLACFRQFILAVTAITAIGMGAAVPGLFWAPLTGGTPRCVAVLADGGVCIV